LDIWIYSLRDHKATPFRERPFNQWNPAFSPDGKYLAYQSDEVQGEPEVFVAQYPGPKECKISISGGSFPRWSASGKELVYNHDGTAMVVDAAALKSCDATPRRLTDGLDKFDLWDVSPTGDFFVTLEQREPPRLHMVVNWFEELKRLTSR
jgi:hypothetical protein